MPTTDESVLVACSGGGDSAAALALLHSSAPDLPLVACYIDHNLRPRSSIQRDIAAVKRQAQLAHATVCVRKIRINARAGSVEATARAARYAALTAAAQRFGARTIVTGHHAGDIAEGVVLGLLRGSGLDGLAATAARRRLAPGLMLVRPLLFAQREELREFVRSLSLPFVEDETNADERLRRNAVRALLASLELHVPGSRRNIARAARLLRGDKALLDQLTARAWVQCRDPQHPQALAARSLRELPTPLLRRVLRYAVALQTGQRRDFSSRQCAAIARAIKTRRGGSFQAGAARIDLSAGRLYVAARDTRPSLNPHSKRPTKVIAIRLRPSGKIVTAFGRLSFSKVMTNGATATPKGQRSSQLFDFASLNRAKLCVRLPRSGDKCIPSGRRNAVSLVRFLAKAGVPKSQRPSTVLLCAENRIVAALGVRVMEPFSPKPGQATVAAHWQPSR